MVEAKGQLSEDDVAGESDRNKSSDIYYINVLEFSALFAFLAFLLRFKRCGY